MAYANSFHQSCILIINERFLLLLYFLKIKKKKKEKRKESLTKKTGKKISVFSLSFFWEK